MTKLSSYLLQYLGFSQQLVGPQKCVGPFDAAPSSISLSEWRVLGPFQIGTRELPWGSDPLEAYGGFHALEYSHQDRYPSSLAINGSVGWTHASSGSVQRGRDLDTEINVSFLKNIDWHLLQAVYGWAALQWQGWLRGSIIIDAEEPELLNLYIGGAVEYWIDDEHYFGGDFYNYARAPLTLRLEPGPHRIEIRLVRDVRAHGGMSLSNANPEVKINLRIEHTSSGIHRGSEVLLPDRLNDYKGPTAGSYGSVILHNVAEDDIYVHSIWGGRNKCTLQLTAEAPIKIAPGQSRPVGFTVSCIPGTSASTSIDLHFQYSYEEDGSNQRSYFAWGLSREPTSMYNPHRMTFLHQSGIVSYAILRPPPISCNEAANLPVMVALHGAGLEADDELVKHSLDGVAELCAWIIFPTGVTPWSGDDWHNWGWSDVEAAVSAIPDWIDMVEWSGPGVDINRWLVTGHSNGGQGTWYAVTHHPGKVFAAAPASGYSSIQNYVPYTFWRSTDSIRTHIIQSQLAKYKHENLLGNARNVPILAQHGSHDDNVPAYHSRLMHELGQELATEVAYSEVSEGHWWDGVMVTPALSDFYRHHLPDAENSVANLQRNVSSEIRNAFKILWFSIVTTDPGSTGDKHGIKVDYLTIPGQVGRLEVHMDEESCSIQASNIARFNMDLSRYRRCQELVINNKPVNLRSVLHSSNATFWPSISGWQLSVSEYELDCRRPSEFTGGLEAILQTRDTFQIVQHSDGSQKTALEIANNLCQYYIADAELTSSYNHALARKGNVVSIALGKDLPRAAHVDCDLECGIYFHDEKILFVKDRYAKHAYEVKEAVAAIYLRPLGEDRLEMVIWANEAADLHLAARLFPIMTGSGQPDFIVVDRSVSLTGLNGVKAMGFYDQSWCPSPTSFFS